MPVSHGHKSVSIIGAGKVGATLALLLRRKGYRILSVISRKKKSARKLAQLVRCKKYSDSLSDIHPSTMILVIAVPEEAIFGISKEIAGYSEIDFARLIVFHTSGAVSSKLLAPLQRKGGIIFSLHPIQSFPKKITLSSQIERMKGVFYGFEGQSRAFKPACLIVRSLGGAIIRIPKERKNLYHIACIFASNYSVALLGALDKVVRRVGGDIKFRHMVPLVRASIENAISLTPLKALTGPIVRGSVETIEKHLRELRRTESKLALLYRHIGMQALEMAAARKSIKPNVAKEIKRILKV